jgi:hypothetical protein
MSRGLEEREVCLFHAGARYDYRLLLHEVAYTSIHVS